MEIKIGKKDTPCCICEEFQNCRIVTDLIVFEMKRGLRILIDSCEKYKQRVKKEETWAM